MNREIQRNTRRRTMSRMNGGGYGMGAPLVNIPSGPGSDWNFAVKQPVNQGFDDCLFPARPGQLFNTPDPALAQAAWPLRGGKRARRGSRRQRGGRIQEDHIVVGTDLYVRQGGATTKYRIHAVDGDRITLRNQEDQEITKTRDELLTSAMIALQEAEINAAAAAALASMPAYRPQLIQSRGGRRRGSRLQSGGGVDSIEASHSYRANGWDQTLNHGASTASAWGRDTGLAQTVMAGGSRRRMRGGGCGCMAGSKLFGGSRRKQRGGASNGYAIDPSVSIGGSGPNVDALRTPVPCDPRAGSMNPINNSEGPADPRAYGVGYSLTPNTTVPSTQAGGRRRRRQRGGAYSTGNAFPPSCYQAPGSSLPVYPAQTAGYNFYPSIARGGVLPDGVTPYMDVVPYAARLGGARKTRRHRSKRNSRKHR